MFISPKFCFLIFLYLTAQFTTLVYSQQLSKLKLSLKSKSIEQHKQNLNRILLDSNSQPQRSHRFSIGLGFFGYNKFGVMAISVNFLPDLGYHLFLNVGFETYKSINNTEDPPITSLSLQALYNINFINSKLNLYVGGGFQLGIFNIPGFMTSARGDYNISSIVALGGEIKYIINKLEFYKYPGFFINCTLNVSPSSKQNKFERR